MQTQWGDWCGSMERWSLRTRSQRSRPCWRGTMPAWGSLVVRCSTASLFLKSCVPSSGWCSSGRGLWWVSCRRTLCRRGTLSRSNCWHRHRCHPGRRASCPWSCCLLEETTQPVRVKVLIILAWLIAVLNLGLEIIIEDYILKEPRSNFFSLQNVLLQTFISNAFKVIISRKLLIWLWSTCTQR